MGSKTCTKCKIEQPLTGFSKCSREADGLQDWCRLCFREVSARYRKANAEKERIRHSKYHQANKEKCNKRVSDWQKKNRDKARAKSRRYYHSHKESEATRMKAWVAVNPEWKKEYIKKWRENNASRCRSQESKRRAAKLVAMPRWADADAIIAIYETSKRLTLTTGVKHHVDHIVPLISSIVCGLHCEANLSVIPATENWKKRNLRWPDMP